MLNLTGEAFISAVYNKKTANGYTITNIVLLFDTSVVIDKERRIYRQDKAKAFILGDHPNLPITSQKIKIIDSQLRVNTWTDKVTKKHVSAPEILILKWEIL